MNEEKFNQLVTDVAVIKARLETFTNTQVTRIDDHEERIRLLEEFKSKAIGAVLASGVFGGIIGALFQFLVGKI